MVEEIAWSSGSGDDSAADRLHSDRAGAADAAVDCAGGDGSTADSFDWK